MAMAGFGGREPSSASACSPGASPDASDHAPPVAVAAGCRSFFLSLALGARSSTSGTSSWPTMDHEAPSPAGVDTGSGAGLGAAAGAGVASGAADGVHAGSAGAGVHDGSSTGGALGAGAGANVEAAGSAAGGAKGCGVYSGGAAGGGAYAGADVAGPTSHACLGATGAS